MSYQEIIFAISGSPLSTAHQKRHGPPPPSPSPRALMKEFLKPSEEVLNPKGNLYQNAKIIIPLSKPEMELVQSEMSKPDGFFAYLRQQFALSIWPYPGGLLFTRDDQDWVSCQLAKGNLMRWLQHAENPRRRHNEDEKEEEKKIVRKKRAKPVPLHVQYPHPQFVHGKRQRKRGRKGRKGKKKKKNSSSPAPSGPIKIPQHIINNLDRNYWSQREAGVARANYCKKEESTDKIFRGGDSISFGKEGFGLHKYPVCFLRR